MKIVFFGDSITQFATEPGGYISLIKEYLGQRIPDHSCELIGAGIAGNKVYDLYFRMDAVLAHNPDIVVIYVGINDVWHKTMTNTGTDLDRFERFYVAMISQFQKIGASVFCCTPTVIGEHIKQANPQDEDLNLYANKVREISDQLKCTFIDLRSSFLEYYINYNTADDYKGILTTDGVHLNDSGNRLVADQLFTQISKLIMR